MSTEAMKLALEALEGINSADNDRDFLGPEECCDLDNAITALQEALALAQPQQEPVAAVAWQQGYDQGVADERISEANIGIAGFNAKVNPARNNPYTPPQPAQEFVCSTGLCHYRKPLTDEEIETVWRNVQANDFHDCVKPFARAIEAAHGIKENT